MAALKGEPVDRAPLAFWMHYSATGNSAKDLAGEALRLAGEFGWDYPKPQSRAQGSAEVWGTGGRQSGHPLSKGRAIWRLPTSLVQFRTELLCDAPRAHGCYAERISSEPNSS
jgi:hypothetical protein